MARRFHMGALEVLPSESRHLPHRPQALLDHRDNLALPDTDKPRDVLDRLLKSRNEQQQERRDGDGNQCEVPIKPKHQTEHEDDRHQVHHDAERRRRGKTLNGRYVRCDGGHQRRGFRGIEKP